MKNQFKMLFHSGKFVVGFVIFILMFFYPLVFPLFNHTKPLDMTGGLFYAPGTYVSISDAVGAETKLVTLDTVANRLAAKVKKSDMLLMEEWLTGYSSVGKQEIKAAAKNKERLTSLWISSYDPSVKVKGTTAHRKEFTRLYDRLETILENRDYQVVEAQKNGSYRTVRDLTPKDFVRIEEVPNSITYVLGTDNFGRDVFAELMSAIRTSLLIGVVAGTVAMLIGLVLGLLAGYLGGIADNIITFFTNMFIVIPSFIILVLVSVSVGSAGRNISTVAIVIGLTSWPWTARAVRAQSLSLRNRDHVNLSKLSGHSVGYILRKDILPYIASYVVMAYILQISSGILSEAQLSMLGLGPSSTEVTTLGVMMNWAIRFQAPLSNAWWAFLPVILAITLISFSLNLMNTGLDQVFNPQLRD
ncbi:MAG: ABC transporter permease [Treponema sp.]|jgi:ABC-type dipeptide/oligopeptide/nickel transport system permease subunit|nr:ABC transporter permease [Treponema sp.]